MAEIVRTAEDIDALCRLAKAAVQGRVPNSGGVLAGYAFGVFDALRWVLGLPQPAPDNGIEPLTTEEIAGLLDGLDG